jgi:hypothetical protein
MNIIQQNEEILSNRVFKYKTNIMVFKLWVDVINISKSVLLSKQEYHSLKYRW